MGFCPFAPIFLTHRTMIAQITIHTSQTVPYLKVKDRRLSARLTCSTSLLVTLNGPATWAVKVNGPDTSSGSRHESEQVLPQPK